MYIQDELERLENLQEVQEVQEFQEDQDVQRVQEVQKVQEVQEVQDFQDVQDVQEVQEVQPIKPKIIRWHLNREQVIQALDEEPVPQVRPTTVARKDTKPKTKLMLVGRDLEARGMEVEELPTSYQFLEEVFNAMDLIVPIMHTRKERLTVTRLLTLVQQNIKKNVLKSDLQKIMFVFPNLYQVSWEKSQVTRKFVLEIALSTSKPRLSPSEIIERRKKFHLSLCNIHKRNPTSEMIDVWDFPAEPFVEPVQTAAQVLQNSRPPMPPRCETPKPAPKPIHKKLKGLPSKLIEKIVAKENDNADRGMFTKTGRAEKIKRLKRLPKLARILKSTFNSEEKTSLPFQMVVKRAGSSHPLHFPSETIISDLRYLIEVSQPWVDNPTVQGIEYLKLNKDIDVNHVVNDVEKLLEDEEDGKQARISGDSYFAAQAEKVVSSGHTMGNLKSPMALEYNQPLSNFNLPYETEVSILPRSAHLGISA